LPKQLGHAQLLISELSDLKRQIKKCLRFEFETIYNELREGFRDVTKLPLDPCAFNRGSTAMAARRERCNLSPDIWPKKSAEPMKHFADWRLEGK